MLRENPTRLEVIEELIHYSQARKAGFPEHQTSRDAEFYLISTELEAQDLLLRIADRNSWGQDEIDVIARNRQGWLEKMHKFNETYSESP